MHTQSYSLAPALCHGPATIAADANGTTIDLLGYERCGVQVAMGVGGITFDATNRIDMILEWSDDGTAWTAATTDNAQVIGATPSAAGVVISQAAAHAAPTVREFDFAVWHRYWRLRLDYVGTHGAGTPLAVIFQRGDARRQPAA